jgi:lipid-binding SYLF domain-containing protein
MFKAASYMLLAMFSLLVGCSTTPQESSERDLLKERSTFVVNRISERNPDLMKDYLARSAGYAVIPTVGEGGFVFAGGYGKGILYEKGKMVGYCDATQMTVGAQIGGQSFSEIIFFETPAVLSDFKAGHFAFKAQVEAVALGDSASKRAQYREGLAVVIADETGLMAQAAAGGQKFRFEPGQ